MINQYFLSASFFIVFLINSSSPAALTPELKKKVDDAFAKVEETNKAVGDIKTNLTDLLKKLEQASSDAVKVETDLKAKLDELERGVVGADQDQIEPGRPGGKAVRESFPQRQQALALSSKPKTPTELNDEEPDGESEPPATAKQIQKFVSMNQSQQPTEKPLDKKTGALEPRPSTAPSRPSSASSARSTTSFQSALSGPLPPESSVVGGGGAKKGVFGEEVNLSPGAYGNPTK